MLRQFCSFIIVTYCAVFKPLSLSYVKYHASVCHRHSAAKLCIDTNSSEDVCKLDEEMSLMSSVKSLVVCMCLTWHTAIPVTTGSNDCAALVRMARLSCLVWLF